MELASKHAADYLGPAAVGRRNGRGETVGEAPQGVRLGVRKPRCRRGQGVAISYPSADRGGTSHRETRPGRGRRTGVRRLRAVQQSEHDSVPKRVGCQDPSSFAAWWPAGPPWASLPSTRHNSRLAGHRSVQVTQSQAIALAVCTPPPGRARLRTRDGQLSVHERYVVNSRLPLPANAIGHTLVGSSK